MKLVGHAPHGHRSISLPIINKTEYIYGTQPLLNSASRVGNLEFGRGIDVARLWTYCQVRGPPNAPLGLDEEQAKLGELHIGMFVGDYSSVMCVKSAFTEQATLGKFYWLMGNQ